MKKNKNSNRLIISEISAYISRGLDAKLPQAVVIKAKHHILDTLAAIISGTVLKPGKLAKIYAENQQEKHEAHAATVSTMTSAINAAFANGIMAHADETDDSHPRSLTHPGCGIVPAALAMSEREEVDGLSFLKAVVVGYEVGCRITQALGVDNLRKASRSTHCIGGLFGAASASAAVAGLKESCIPYVLSFGAQQASGVRYWVRDPEHVEKAFVFGGLPARNGVTAAILIKSGFTGVNDPFSGEHNFLEAFSPDPRPELLSEGLGIHYEIMFTNIKKFPVGSPIQSPLDALLLLISENGLKAQDVEKIEVHLPERRARTVDNRKMPDVNLQYILAVTLLDGSLTFKNAHSFERMNDPAVLDLVKRIRLLPYIQLPTSKPTHQTIIDVTTIDGEHLCKPDVIVRGMVENPMTMEEVETKCSELITPILGQERSQTLINKVRNLEQVRNVRELGILISAS